MMSMCIFGQDLKSFRHSIQTASETSSPAHDDPNRSMTSAASPSSNVRHQQSPYSPASRTNPLQQPTKPSPPVRNTLPRRRSATAASTTAIGSTIASLAGSTAATSAMPVDIVVDVPSHRPNATVVPLAVLDEFTGVGSCVGFGTDSEYDVSAGIPAQSRRVELHHITSGAKSNGRVSPGRGGGGEKAVAATEATAACQVDCCVVDMNSNAKDRTIIEENRQPHKQQILTAAVNPAPPGAPAVGTSPTAVTVAAPATATASQRYEHWDPTLFDEDLHTADVTADFDDVTDSHVNPMLEFAEHYFNVHPTQYAGYQAAIVRTVNIVTRKTSSVSYQLDYCKALRHFFSSELIRCNF